MNSENQFSPPAVKVLMVCLGNICRSPTAHGVFHKIIKTNNLEQYIKVDSAGTGDWHIGESPDNRAIKAAAKRGYQIGTYKARQVCASDFEIYNYILAMDHTNLLDLKRMCPAAHQTKLQLLLSWGDSLHDTVPDPFYSGDEGFKLVLDLVEDACEKLLRHIKDRHFLIS